jgi:hypothetical protein
MFNESYYPRHELRKLGVGPGIFDLSELIGQPVKQHLVAYCTSKECGTGHRKKNVPFHATECPDCEHALYWQKT